MPCTKNNIMRKQLIQKLQHLIDELPRSEKKSEVISDYLELKLTDDDLFVLSMKDKYSNK